DVELVRRMVENHYKYTGSEKAEEVLQNWDDYVGMFVKVMPDPYARVVQEHMENGEDIRASPPPKPEVEPTVAESTD
ncbi:MAG: hypothetical protein SXQ77_02980, partial [Halobacteria archaeon]|nr:hypothetical protein [Halobacteria archaeon]